MRRAATAVSLVSALGLGCFSAPAPMRPMPFDSASLTHGSPERNWPLTPAQADRLMDSPQRLQVRHMEEIGTGVTGAFKFEVYDETTDEWITFKWKEMPAGDADGWNNSPRKELAAYALQALVLDARDYVVPWVGARCVPMARYRVLRPKASATLPETKCVLGMASLWLENVTIPDRLMVDSRFEGEPLYAYHLAHLNLVTHLMDHRDGRHGNFLVSNDPANPRVFTVDNGISFEPLIYNFLVDNWNILRVPALTRGSVARLRSISEAQWESLGVLLEMRADAKGVLRKVTAETNWDPESGARVQPGAVQLGLTRSEIRRLRDRIEAVLSRVDRGQIPVF